MRVFLASSTCGLNPQDREVFIDKGKPLYLLNTFYEGEKKCLKVLQDVGRENFLLDSGAFSFMSGAACSEKVITEYCERYIQFINDNKIPYYFEMDVDTIFGLPFAESLRAKLEKETMRPSIPVWHKNRGVEYWKKMCAEYKYVAIGGLVFHVKQSEWPLIKKMVDYAYSKGVKVHGLGFTKTKMLKDWNWYSIDSSSWTKAAALGQQRHDFDVQKGYITSRRVDGKGKKVNLSKLILHNGLEWCRYQRYMEGQRW